MLLFLRKKILTSKNSGNYSFFIMQQTSEEYSFHPIGQIKNFSYKSVKTRTDQSEVIEMGLLTISFFTVTGHANVTSSRIG